MHARARQMVHRCRIVAGTQGNEEENPSRGFARAVYNRIFLKKKWTLFGSMDDVARFVAAGVVQEVRGVATRWAMSALFAVIKISLFLLFVRNCESLLPFVPQDALFYLVG